jgi:adenosylcobinamide-GDP ribazoletransferase
MIAGLVAALRFLTRLPVPGRDTTGADLGASLAWFPPVGAACNAAVAGVFLAAALCWPAPVAAVLAVAVGLALTGCFHEDAVADSADGLGGGGPDRARVLIILKDSRIGSYGAAALWVVLSLRVAALWALSERLGAPLAVAAFALAGAWGRWTAAPLLRLPAAAASGLAKDLAAGIGWGPLLAASAWALTLTAGAWWLGLAAAPAMAVAALAATAAWAWYLWKRMGGQCGDLLGAGNQLVEAVALLAALGGRSWV